MLLEVHVPILQGQDGRGWRKRGESLLDELSFCDCLAAN